MISAAIWIALLYLALKLCHLMMGSGSRFGRQQQPVAEKLKAGEPWLITGTVLICVLVLTFGHWWGQRNAEGHYAYSTDCYAKITTSDQLPRLPRKFGSYKAAGRASHYENFAKIHGAKIGTSIDAIDTALEQRRAAQAAFYSRIAKAQDRRAIAASLNELDRCLKGHGSPKGELLDP